MSVSYEKIREELTKLSDRELLKLLVEVFNINELKKKDLKSIEMESPIKDVPVLKEPIKDINITGETFELLVKLFELNEPTDEEIKTETEMESPIKDVPVLKEPLKDINITGKTLELLVKMFDLDDSDLQAPGNKTA